MENNVFFFYGIPSGKRLQFANLNMAHWNSWFTYENSDFP